MAPPSAESGHHAAPKIEKFRQHPELVKLEDQIINLDAESNTYTAY